jgi:hypothetical protein
MYVCVCVYVCVLYFCMCIYVCMYVCMHAVCIYVCIYVCVYVCMYETWRRMKKLSFCLSIVYEVMRSGCSSGIPLRRVCMHLYTHTHTLFCVATRQRHYTQACTFIPLSHRRRGMSVTTSSWSGFLYAILFSAHTSTPEGPSVSPGTGMSMLEAGSMGSLALRTTWFSPRSSS